ncbi:uncharacterized protein METZ01_LOCUS314668 [marine metagenome]|uniref:Uncharacterized protein n=1 Tax=marine metagenome TaxID=408172 RepID=A0A382NKT5_9ZZZZ
MKRFLSVLLILAHCSMLFGQQPVQEVVDNPYYQMGFTKADELIKSGLKLNTKDIISDSIMPEGLSENDKELFKKGFRARIKSSHSTTIPRKEARFLRSFGCIVLTIFFIVIPIQNSGKGL